MFCVSRGWWYYDSDSTKERNNLEKNPFSKPQEISESWRLQTCIYQTQRGIGIFWIRVVSLSQGVCSFSFFRLKGLPSLSPHMKHYATPNMTMVFGKIESATDISFWMVTQTLFKSKIQLCFLLLDPKISRGISHHGACNSPTTHRLSGHLVVGSMMPTFSSISFRCSRIASRYLFFERPRWKRSCWCLVCCALKCVKVEMMQ